MAATITVETQTVGQTTIEFQACYKLQQLAVCKITWFPLQKTAHVWFAAPAVYNKHAITSFQRFQGDTFQELVDVYLRLFYQITWLFVPVIQKKRSIEVLPYLVEDMDEKVAALVRCLVAVKNNVSATSKHESRKKAGWHWKKRICSRYRVDDGASNQATTQ